MPKVDDNQLEFEQINMVQFLPIRDERLKSIKIETEKDEILQTNDISKIYMNTFETETTRGK